MGSIHKADLGDTRTHRMGGFLNSLASDALKEFQSYVSLVCYPAHAVLFEEEQKASSVLIVLKGCAKISVNSREGKRLILWIVRPVEFLGLASVLRGSCHEETAETVHPCSIASIRRQEFLDFLMRYPSVNLGVARELSVEMSRAREQMRIMGLSSSASIKLAWLLLEWSVGMRKTACGTSVTVPLTHEEMGECIGVTRETVTRAMTDLRQRGLIDLRGSALIITNRFALKAFAEGMHQTTPREASSTVDRAGRPGFPRSLPRGVTEITAGRHLNRGGIISRQQ
ncbi:MAG: Crp/Fnr family transcriptional regulator [Acidobacteriaceae bacterium]